MHTCKFVVIIMTIAIIIVNFWFIRKYDSTFYNRDCYGHLAIDTIPRGIVSMI